MVRIRKFLVFRVTGLLQFTLKICNEMLKHLLIWFSLKTYSIHRNKSNCNLTDSKVKLNRLTSNTYLTCALRPIRERSCIHWSRGKRPTPSSTRVILSPPHVKSVIIYSHSHTLTERAQQKLNSAYQQRHTRLWCNEK